MITYRRAQHVVVSDAVQDPVGGEILVQEPPATGVTHPLHVEAEGLAAILAGVESGKRGVQPAAGILRETGAEADDEAVGAAAPAAANFYREAERGRADPGQEARLEIRRESGARRRQSRRLSAPG